MTLERRPVCQRCAQIKQACDGNIPCSRCVRLSLPCRPRNAPAGSAGVYAANSPQPVDVPKARIRRVQTGCLMCKQRKKKCDEIKPKCGDCRRLCLECRWPPDKLRDKVGRAAVHATPLRDYVPPSRQHEQVFEHEPMEIYMEQQPQQQPLPQIHAIPDPATSQAPSSASAVPVTSALPISTTTELALRNHSPVSASPPSLKHESSSDDDVIEVVNGHAHPEPIHYSEMVVWDSPSMASDASVPWYEMVSPNSISGYSSPDSVESTSLTVFNPTSFPQLPSQQDRALLNHYKNIVSPLLSRRSNPTSNPYLQFLLPIAESNDLVLNCLLALSGNHWRKIQPALGHRGLEHKGKATAALLRLLPSLEWDRSNADIALISSLLLCMTELFDGTSVGWKHHLTGARKLLATFREQQDDLSSGQYKFLLRLSRFLDSAATVSTCRPPLLEEEARIAEAVEGMAPAADSDDSAVYGIPKELFHLVDQINSLADKRKNRVDEASEAVFRREAAHVEERIDHWSFEYGGINRAVSTLAPADGDAIHATTAFEHALRLRLHQILEGYELDHPKVTHHVEGILDAVQKVRYGSPLESCLLFPLVMAGGACSEPEHRVVIQDRLMVMERTCGFGYVYNARDLVERVWNRRDQTEPDTIVNWARIRYEEMHGLVVF